MGVSIKKLAKNASILTNTYPLISRVQKTAPDRLSPAVILKIFYALNRNSSNNFFRS